ncbi:MAG: glycosyl hydrolase 53 family protein [Clostridiales bacterium]|nr:glycosyl hydrolase 53 family protein [Clostridiales bacterium]
MDGNLLTNGDFEDSEDDSWTILNLDYTTSEYNTGNSTTYLYKWANSKTSVFASQTLESVDKGKYKASVYVGGEYSSDSFTLTVTSGDDTTLASMDLSSASSAWGTWSKLTTDSFEITSDNNSSVTVKVSGTLSDSNSTEQQIHIDNIVLEAVSDYYTKEQLQTLYDTYKDYDESKYTSASWSAMSTALSGAKTILEDSDKTDDNSAADITEAYEALEAAAEGLELEDVTITLHYYSADAEPVFYYWGDNISTEAAACSAYLWSEGDAYTMTASEYAGWYSIDVAFSDEGMSSGFELYAYTSDGIESSSALYKCSAEYDAKEVYAALISGDDTDYAVKNSVLYTGSDDITALMRNVTLYVYDDAGTPAIEVASATELSCVDEEEGTVTALTASYTEDWGNFYSMTAVEDEESWYCLTFSVPAGDEGDTVCQLYSENSTGWVTNFINGGTADDYNTDISPVFDGDVYYKDGTFYSSIELAEGITLAMLKELVISDDVMAITENGEDSYDTDLWSTFSSALEAANKLIDETYADVNDDDVKTTTGDDITDAYTALKEAVDAMVVSNAAITLYYYVGETDYEVGVYSWQKTITWGEAGEASWTPWSGTTFYLMNETAYSGWYSIDMEFGDTANTEEGFEIYTASVDENGDYVDGSSIWSCSQQWNYTEIYAALVSGDAEQYAVKDFIAYAGDDATAALRNVTMYVYDNTGTPAIMSEEEIKTLDASTGTAAALTADDTDEWGNQYYDMTADESASNWYYLTFSVPDAEDGGQVFQLYTDNDGSYTWQMNFINGGTADDWNVDITPVFSGYIYYKDGVLSDTISKLAQLQALIAEAESLVEADYTAATWETLEAALKSAKEVAENEASTDEEIEGAIEALTAAIEALKYATQASVNVEQIALSDDFITGADLSSYVALKESGVVFKDEDGNALTDQEFFNYLYDGGMNWVRIRVWNDPYDSNHNGYGGGNSDLDKAIVIGKYATNAGMRVLIDFHYSDFWSDPAKYDAPKAWAGYGLDEKAEAVYDFTLDSLNELKAAGVDVGMVQVGNETNSGICGETSTEGMNTIFKAGASAVRKFDSSCLVAVHFTDPQSGFSTYVNGVLADVDYDVFGASFYPYWHGTTSQLTTALTEVAKQGKYVMVAETSWATTWEDGDGHGNSAPKTSGQDLNYDISIQGQANEIRDVVNAVNAVNDSYAGKGLGVFYWEPAWLSAYYVYNADGSVDQNLYKQNQALWEEYGSGWASSYSYEYDPTDAGLWYGGSAVDNQAWFDFDGTALPTAKIYSLIRTGASASLDISEVQSIVETTVSVGESIDWDNISTVSVKYNDGTTGTAPVTWDQEQKDEITTDKTGEYTVSGVAVCTLEASDGTTQTKKYNVTLTVKVMPTGNVLTDPSFEGSDSNWSREDGRTEKNDGDTWKIASDENNARTGSNGVNFYQSGSNAFCAKVTQTLTGLTPGTYTFGGYIQGGSAAEKDVQYAVVTVKHEDGTSTNYKDGCSLGGWLNWQNPEIAGIEVVEGDTVTVGFEVSTTKVGAWGWIDDLYLYGSYQVEVADSQNGSITVSDLEPDNGEVVRVTVKADTGYTVGSVSVSGNSVAGAILSGSEGSASFASGSEEGGTSPTATVTYGDSVTFTTASFTMPAGNVTVSAEFVNVLESDTPIDISGASVEIEDQYYTGKAIKPGISVTYKGYTLTSKDYSVAYANNREVTDSAAVTITGKGKFTGQTTATFKIVEDTRIDLSKIKPSVELGGYDAAQNNYYYTGEEIEPEVKRITYRQTITETDADTGKAVKKEVEEELSSEYYTVAYQNNIKVGKKASVIIIGDGVNCKGSYTQTFTIAKRPITEEAGITISTPAGSTYTGKKITPYVAVKYGKVVLQKGTDYTVSYKNNTNAGTAYLTITGKGNYTGKSADISFTISRKSLSDFSIEVTAKDIIAPSRATAPTVTVKDGTKTVSSSQYTVSVSGNSVEGNKVREEGTYTVTVTANTANENCNYTGEAAATLRVVGKEYLLSNASVKTTNKVYTGSAIRLSAKTDEEDTEAKELTVTVGKGANAKTLIQGQDYTATYENNTKTGKATITIKGMGDYAGTKTATFKITQRTLLANWEGDELTEKQQETCAVISEKPEIESDSVYGTERYYTGYAITPDLEEIKVTNGSTSVVFKKGTDYTISYKNNVKAGAEAYAVITGKGNYKGKITVKNLFTVQDRTLDDLAIYVAPAVYTGKAVKPTIRFIDKNYGVEVDLKLNTAYSVSYKNNKKISGKATGEITQTTANPYVIIKEKGLNGAQGAVKQSKTISYAITTAAITSSCVQDITAQTYKNKAVTPSWSISVNGRKLKAGTDYVVTYTDNNKRGTATATITGIGNYSGTAVKKFIIK